MWERRRFFIEKIRSYYSQMDLLLIYNFLLLIINFLIYIRNYFLHFVNTFRFICVGWLILNDQIFHSHNLLLQKINFWLFVVWILSNVYVVQTSIFDFSGSCGSCPVSPPATYVTRKDKKKLGAKLVLLMKLADNKALQSSPAR